MFIGVSKNIGNGFRVGIGTKLGGNKKLSAKELKTKEFQEFIQKVQDDINNALLIFLEANGQSYKELLKSKVDLDDMFKDNSDYKEFISILNQTKKDIEKILYVGDSGIVAKRTIADSVFSLKEFIDNKYPNIVPKEKIKKPMNKFLKWTLIVFTILFFIGLLGDHKKVNNQQETNSNPIQTVSK